MLNSRDIAFIFGSAQIVSAIWKIDGGVVFLRNGCTLRVDNQNGITIVDASGQTIISLPINGTSITLGQPVSLGVMSTVKRNTIKTPTEGMVIYNIDVHHLEFYNGSTWGAV